MCVKIKVCKLGRVLLSFIVCFYVKLLGKMSMNTLVCLSGVHRRRMELEDKAKVITSLWGTELVQFLAVLAVLPWSI